jgi:hypothetical protein
MFDPVDVDDVLAVLSALCLGSGASSRADVIAILDDFNDLDRLSELFWIAMAFLVNSTASIANLEGEDLEEMLPELVGHLRRTALIDDGAR